jgi:hypothetical protein
MNKYLDLEYPYYNLYYKLDKKQFLKIIKDFNPIIYFDKLPNKLNKFTIEKYNDKYFVIDYDYDKTYEINNITNYFSESVRVKCKFGNYESPLVYWTKNKKQILSKTLQQYKILNIKNIQDTIFFSTKLCNNFPLTPAITVIKHFKAKKWLDISAGWGDRLMTAILCKMKLYVSTDPNLELHPCYDKIIETFASPSQRKNFIIYKNGFLEAQLPDVKFDIVFSSPPFFTLEKYSNYAENSITKFKTEKEWCDNFFVKSLIKAYNHLKKNGMIILYMGAYGYIGQQMHKLDKIMDYRGQIYFCENKPRGMFVWIKTKNDLINSLDI